MLYIFRLTNEEYSKYLKNAYDNGFIAGRNDIVENHILREYDFPPIESNSENIVIGPENYNNQNNNNRDGNNEEMSENEEVDENEGNENINEEEENEEEPDYQYIAVENINNINRHRISILIT